ncbi:MAG: helix-turn-helix domain-containing protein [Firmicutes bacterium]|nr:helix-turn-helix domain-containing protein [Bacillota bacterium]
MNPVLSPGPHLWSMEVIQPGRDYFPISNVNLSKIKTGKVSGVRFTTLDGICNALDCQPGDILEYQEDE